MLRPPRMDSAFYHDSLETKSLLFMSDGPSTTAQMTWPSGLEVHMGLVTLRSVTIGAALLLICCDDPEAKARRLLNQAQVLEREGKEQEAQPLLDELLQGYPQTTAATALTSC